MMKKLLFLLGVLLFVCSVSINNATATEFIQNGGFETGTFEGWLPINAEIVSAPYPVYNGNYAAGLSVSSSPSGTIYYLGASTLSALLIQEIVGFEGTDQMFTASYAYNVDVLRSFSNNDDALYIGYLASLDTTIPPTLIAGGTVVQSGDSGGWQTGSNFADLSGLNLEHLYLGFFFAETELVGGSLGDVSSAFLDDISVTANAVPEPATMLLLGSGLLGLVGFRKRMKNRKK